jgi:hypothetical protein
VTNDVKQVLAAIAANDKAEKDSLDRMHLIKRQEIARDLKAGRRVLTCCCPDCIERAISLEEPDPYRCAGARARAAEERVRAAKDQSEASL